MRYLKAFITSFLMLGWGFPLLLALHFENGAVRCIETEMLCSFPHTHMVETLVSASFIWMVVSILAWTFFRK